MYLVFMTKSESDPYHSACLLYFSPLISKRDTLKPASMTSIALSNCIVVAIQSDTVAVSNKTLNPIRKLLCTDYYFLTL